MPTRKSIAIVLLLAIASLSPVQAANYYVGNDGACTHDRLALAVFSAALAGDSSPQFFISKSKPAETAEIILNWNNLSTVQVRGGYNSCQDAINNVTPSGKSSVHSDARATNRSRRVMTVGGNNSSPTVTLQNVFISGGRLDTNTAPDSYGAGIYVATGTLSLIGTTVEGNWNNPANSNALGGGIHIRGSGRTLLLSHTALVRDNDAQEGGGIYCMNNAVILMEGADIRDNRARFHGGGIKAHNGCQAVLASDSISGTPGRIRNNQVTNVPTGSDRGGGGLAVSTNSTVSVGGSSGIRFQITGNQTLSEGGGIAVYGSGARLITQFTDIDANSTPGNGGGIHCINTGSTHDAVEINTTRIRNNQANANGGGLLARHCRATISNGSEITGNSANAQFFSNGGGGGIAALALDSSTFSRITVTGGSQPVVIQSNTGRNGGGALAVMVGAGSNRTAEIILNNVRVVSNQVVERGGGLAAIGEGARITMRRTLEGSNCHHSNLCSVLNLNSVTGGTLDGSAAAVVNNADLTISGTLIRNNTGRALFAQNLQSPRRLRLESNRLRSNQTSRPLIWADNARVLLNFNTLDYRTQTSGEAFRIANGNSTDRQAYIYGNIFQGSQPPVTTAGSTDWFTIGSNGGCAGFSQAHLEWSFYLRHTSDRRYVGTLPLSDTTSLITEAGHRIVDFCDSGDLGAPATDALGASRPYTTSRPNANGNVDLGAHETRAFDIAANVSGQGTVTSSPSGLNCPGGICTWPFSPFTTAQVTAAPASGWGFSQWTGSCTGTNPVCSLTMSINHSVSAIFLQLFNLNVFISGVGSVDIQPDGMTCSSNCTHQFMNGTTVTLTANPGPGKQFAGWIGACSGTDSCTLNMTTNRSVAAEFIDGPDGDMIFSDRFSATAE